MVQTDTGSVATYPETLTYLPPRPEIFQIGPDQGPTEGDTIIAINGAHFYSYQNRVPEVEFGSYQAEVTHIGRFGNALVRLPARCSISTVDVKVTNPVIRYPGEWSVVS